MSKQKQKTTEYEKRKRDSIDIEIAYDLPKKVELYISGPVPSKKNQKQAFRGIVLPSKNYLRRHKILIDKIGKRKRKYKTFPCKMFITIIAGTKAKGDVDNILTSYMDLLCDIGLLPDDNKFIIPEVQIRNVGYAKNCWLTAINIEPYELNNYNIVEDHRGNNLLNYKHYVNGYTLRG